MRKLLILLLISPTIYASPAKAPVTVEWVEFERRRPDDLDWMTAVRGHNYLIFASADITVWLVKRRIFEHGKLIDQAGFCHMDLQQAKNKTKVRACLIIPKPGFSSKWNMFVYYVVKDINGTHWEVWLPEGSIQKL